MINFTTHTLEIKPYDTRPHMSAEDKRKAGIDSHIVSTAGQILAYCDTREEAELVRDEFERMSTRVRREQHAKLKHDDGIDLDAVFATLAQGVINIESRLTTIEAGSRVHRAMSLLCELRTAGKL